MSKLVNYRLPTDLARDPTTGSLRRMNPKDLSRRGAHRMKLLNKSPKKRPGYEA